MHTGPRTVCKNNLSSVAESFVFSWNYGGSEPIIIFLHSCNGTAGEVCWCFSRCRNGWSAAQNITCNNYGLADVRISRQAYFCSLGCTVIWPLRHFVYCSIGYILPPRKLPGTKIIVHILCSTIARVEKYNNCRINLVLFSWKRRTQQRSTGCFTYSSRAYMHRISVLLDLAVKVKFFHWRRTSVIRGAAQIAGVIRDCNWSDSTDVNNDLQGHRKYINMLYFRLKNSSCDIYTL